MARTVLSGDVYDTLRERILAGALAPGVSLSEERLAQDLNVSRTPLREALRRLAEGGLVVHRPHRGARVQELTPSLVREVFEVREALEGMAARSAAARISDERLRFLRERFAHLAERVAAGDLSDVGDAIHDETLAACGNERLTRAMKVHRDQVAWIQNACYRVEGSLGQAFQTVLPALMGERGEKTIAAGLRRAFGEHEGVLMALEARDPEWAETAMRAHIRATRRDVLTALEDRAA